MRIMITLSIVLFIAACNGSSSNSSHQNDDYILRSQSVKEKIINAFPHLTSVSDKRQLALELREIAHFNIITEKSNTNYFYQPDLNIEKTIIQQEIGYICGGISITHQQLLAAFGIPSRYVGMFTAPYVSANSHASTEVYLNGKWEISDATFNYAILDQHGNRLSAEELFNEVVNNNPISFEIGPNGNRPERDIYNYFESIENLAAHIVIYPGPYDSFSIYLPNSWDGSYSFNGNTGIMTYSPNSIYGLINESSKAPQ